MSENVRKSVNFIFPARKKNLKENKSLPMPIELLSRSIVNRVVSGNKDLRFLAMKVKKPVKGSIAVSWNRG